MHLRQGTRVHHLTKNSTHKLKKRFWLSVELAYLKLWTAKLCFCEAMKGQSRLELLISSLELRLGPFCCLYYTLDFCYPTSMFTSLRNARMWNNHTSPLSFPRRKPVSLHSLALGHPYNDVLPGPTSIDENLRFVIGCVSLLKPRANK